MLCKTHVIWHFKNLVIRVVNFRIWFLKKKKKNSSAYSSMWKLLCWLNLQTDLHSEKYTHTKRKLLIQWRCSPKELFFDSVFSWVWEGNFSLLAASLERGQSEHPCEHKIIRKDSLWISMFPWTSWDFKICSDWNCLKYRLGSG